jgi:hypothetical protein
MAATTPGFARRGLDTDHLRAYSGQLALFSVLSSAEGRVVAEVGRSLSTTAELLEYEVTRRMRGCVDGHSPMWDGHDLGRGAIGVLWASRVGRKNEEGI